MNLDEAISKRHAVRSYQDKKIEQDKIKELNKEIASCNEEGKVSIQLITDDKKAFTGLKVHFGGFHGVANYIALVGPNGGETQEKLGYFGERIVLKAQQLGLNTCWVAVTYNKGKCKAIIKENQQLVGVIAIGYGSTQGVPHKSKPMNELCQVEGNMPEWFENGMKAVMYAPTAMNKQNFCVVLKNGVVHYNMEKSRYSNIDLGIIKYHFQLGADLES